MGGLSLPHLIVLALVVLILFGRGRISEMMGDFGKGIKSFKQGMSDEDNKPVPPPPAQIQQQTPPAAPPASATQAPTAAPSPTDQTQ
ncbi:MAG: twin-arginine translocase TatA/TatE family subunit [Novosphingobium meiothermophilum]|uniref:twin-arginine translocase TatA/TatE family subunit n=1 Tax=Novosphingobium TaxID=165696 RepID=UPI000D6E206B|nr:MULTISPECIES: twin-arginine translocase TatA/TatE family subunit [Novosphingobium]